ncbi:hypothetical protein R1flu_017864 [Riccia fluitans]|uniref:F-box domain-containing protein n=1 Tax=Riccia fluitans TaxID=41844 RepID=A0ABD1ZFJ4_9MARC
MRESDPPDRGDVENGVKRQIGITDQSGGSSFIVDTDFPEELVGKILSQIPFPQVYKVRTLSKYWCSKFRRRGNSQESLYPLGDIIACKNWPSYPVAFCLRHEVYSFKETVLSSTGTLRRRPYRRVSVIDLFVFNSRSNSWQSFGSHPRLSWVFKTPDLDTGLLSPHSYRSTSSWAIGGSLLAVLICYRWKTWWLLVTNWLTGDSEEIQTPYIAVIVRPLIEIKVILVGPKDYEVFHLVSHCRALYASQALSLICHRYNSVRKTWSSHSVVVAHGEPGPQIVGDSSLPYWCPYSVWFRDAIYALIHQEKKIFLVNWSLQNGSYEKKCLPVEYEDDLQVYEAGIFLVRSKLLVVVLFENVELEALPDI